MLKVIIVFDGVLTGIDNMRLGEQQLQGMVRGDGNNRVIGSSWPDSTVYSDVPFLFLQLIVQFLLEIEHLLLHGVYFFVGTDDSLDFGGALLYAGLELLFMELVRVQLGLK